MILQRSVGNKRNKFGYFKLYEIARIKPKG